MKQRKIRQVVLLSRAMYMHCKRYAFREQYFFNLENKFHGVQGSRNDAGPYPFCRVDPVYGSPGVPLSINLESPFFLLLVVIDFHGCARCTNTLCERFFAALTLLMIVRLEKIYGIARRSSCNIYLEMNGFRPRT